LPWGVVIMHIRPAARPDLPRLIAALRQPEYFADRLDRQAHDRGVLLVAWMADHPVGAVYLWLEPAEEPELRRHLPGTPLITHLEVRRPFRRRGVATALLNESHRYLSRCGHQQVALGVHLENRAALLLYHKLGYRQWPHPAVATPADTFQVLVKRLPKSEARRGAGRRLA
jgi:GNAT superfamily N-acetyltransferase